MSTIPELTKHARELMHKAVESTKREFTSIRSGKASTSLLDLVRVEAYGSTVPLNQVAMVAAPEPRLLTVQPFDKSLTAVEKAIRDADLGPSQSRQSGRPHPDADSPAHRGTPEGPGQGGPQAGRGRPHRRAARPDRGVSKDQEDRQDFEDEKPGARRTSRKPPTSTSSRSTS